MIEIREIIIKAVVREPPPPPPPSPPDPNRPVVELFKNPVTEKFKADLEPLGLSVDKEFEVSVKYDPAANRYFNFEVTNGDISLQKKITEAERDFFSA